MGRDVFLSYKSEDSAAAQRLCEGLEFRNVTCWMAPRDIPAGSEWPAAIVAAISSSRTFVLLLSSSSTHAKQISREAELADKQGLPILTVRLEDVQPPPELSYFLGNIQWIDAFGNKFDAAVACIAELASQSRSSSSLPKAMSAAAAAASPVPTSTIPPADPLVHSVEPSPTLQPSARKSANAIAIIAGTLVLAAALLGWFLLHRGNPSADLLHARATADRFLEERAAGNFEAAWSEYTPRFRDNVNRQRWEADENMRRSHGQNGYQFKECSPESGGYVCNYDLLYSDGHSMNQRLWLTRNSAGAWLISKGEISSTR